MAPSVEGDFPSRDWRSKDLLGGRFHDIVGLISNVQRPGTVQLLIHTPRERATRIISVREVSPTEAERHHAQAIRFQ